MTFKDIKTTPETTVVFFPATLGGSLNNALKKEGITGWKIMKTHEAEEQYGTKCPTDENGRRAVKMYDDAPNLTRQIKAFVSNFDKAEITKKIYELHFDEAAVTYRAEQSALVRKVIDEDGMS